MIDKATFLTHNPASISTTPMGEMQTTDQPHAETVPDTVSANPLYPPQGPEPEGTNPALAEQMAQETAGKGEAAPGVAGEQVVWEAWYSMKNFAGRLTLWTLASVGWLALVGWSWSKGWYHGAGALSLQGLGIVLGIAWILLLFRMFQARHCHFYQLTTRRIFVSTGLLRRRRDQMELIGVKDVFEKQTLMDRWLGIGTVVVVSPQTELPTFYLSGVNDPKRVMDLIWHYARTERETKTVQVENV